jgi:hypothetical protein
MLTLYFSIGFAIFMAGLLIEALLFRAIHADPPSMYRLFAVRDNLIRVVIEGKVERQEPHFAAIYRNVNILIAGCRRLSGPDGWSLAKIDGKHLAHRRAEYIELADLPRDALPASLEPIILQLRGALEHIVDHHFGLNVLIDASRRESARIQKSRARALLKMMPDRLAWAAQ